MERPKNQATLCIPLHENKVLLGMKKRGFGAGKYNGFGGKPIKREKIEETAVWELYGESGLKCYIGNLKKVAEFDFFFPHKPEWNQIVHVYLISKFFGKLQETKEMAFQWFDKEKIPYHQMWDDDKHWLPLILEGKTLNATFIFKEENGENIVDHKKIKIQARVAQPG